MRHRVITSALLAMALAACGGDGKITEPQVAASKVRVLAAVGTDPVTGATIETNLDDYLPGGTVSLVGRGWAPNETVHLVMIETPDAHPDVIKDVQADATGAFSVEFYVVQESDLGATFTLTATGATSGSNATATFTDGNFAMRAAFTPSGGPSFNGTLLKFAQSTVCDPASSGQTPTNATVTTAAGPSAGVTDDQSARLTVPASVPGYAFSNWTVSGGTVTLQAGSVLTNPSICVQGTESGIPGARTFTANYVAVATNTAPTVSAGADATVNEGATFSQNGSFTDPDANSWTATVDYGDGSGVQALSLSGKNFTLSHVYADNGAYNVTVTVNDGTANGSDAVLVTVNNVAPGVSAGADATIAGGGTFSQSGSFTDPGSDTWTATVDYGDGGGAQALTLGAGKTFSLSHTYASSGSFTITVTVTDDDGGTGSDQVQVNVNNTAPTVSAGGDATINEGGTFSQSGSFTDPDPDTWSATVDYGDGSGSQALTLSGKNFTLSHVYANDGTFTVTVTVTDSKGGSGSDQVTVNVNNVAPSVSGGADANVNEGSLFSQGGSFTDPGADTWTATVDYGDGSGSQTLALVGKTFTLNHTYADNGTYTVKIRVNDDDTFGEDEVTVNVANVAPTVSAGGNASLNEGSTFTRNGSFTDPGADTWTATVDYGDGGGAQALTLGAGKTFSLSHTYPDNGTFTVTVTVTDDDGGVGSSNFTLTVLNVAPTVYAGADATINEGSAFSQNGSFTDPGADTWTATVNYGDGSGVLPLTLSGKNFTLNHTYTDNGSYTVTVTVTDDDGAAGSDVVTVTVNNVAPNITSLTVPMVPIAAGTNNVTVSWKFDDPGADTWSCQISWDTGLAFEPSVQTFTANPTKTCSATKTLDAGIYTVTARVTDDDGGSDTETATTYIVVYDPSAGFVTGGGWINSLPGAYAADPELAGKANFGFVSKYKKGQTVPDGNTEFQFHAGNLNFKSMAYEWLVVAGAKAQFKGTGTINGGGNYGFMLTAIDGQVNGGGGIDKFRMKIWIMNPDNTETVVYDNQMGAVVDANPTTVLGGGSINIQAK